ncbi:hypothetical protein [Mitsuokella multacida]|uniref:hypothetical protein n=1 Tax=Mitsuokella multacida TaxID=52226 RepID=UPI003F6444E1
MTGIAAVACPWWSGRQPYVRDTKESRFPCGRRLSFSSGSFLFLRLRLARAAGEEVDEDGQHDAEQAVGPALLDECIDGGAEAEEHGEERLFCILAAVAEGLVVDADFFLEAGRADDLLLAVLALMHKGFLLAERAPAD